jgi:DNA repair photolyase
MLRWRTVEDEPQGVLFADDEVVERHVGRGEFRGLEFLHVRCRTIVNRVPAASRMPFSHTINAYRGCSHACVYCFARPTHHYLGLGIGEDFERKIVVKVNAVERLRAELAAPRWRGEAIAMGTNTDPYQRAEGKYHLTQGIIGILAEAANPFSLLTKSTLVLRDLDLLVAAAARTSVRVNLSIGTLDDDVWRTTEPGTPHPRRRVEAVARLTDAGIPCGVLVAPVLPGLSDGDEQLADVVGACVDAGAVSVSAMYLHLRPGTRDHWFEWMATALPDHVADYERRYRGRAYVHKQDQRQLTTRVNGLVHAARQRRSARQRAPRAPATRRGPPYR